MEIFPSVIIGRKTILPAALLLFCAAFPLFARGAGENNALTRADALIANREYDAAMDVLSGYMRENPDSFGEAQKRLQRIIRLREQYNELATELLDTLEADPGNAAKILELSERLRGMESSGNPAARDFLEQTRHVAVFNVNRGKLEQILADARGLLERNDFRGALAAYASGLDLYRQEFFSSGYGEDAEDTAQGGLDAINKNIADFNTYSEPFAAGTLSFVNVCESAFPEPAALDEAYGALLPFAEGLARMKRDLLEIRESFARRNALIGEEFGIPDDRTFLAFAGRLLEGPAGQNEGMIGTLERFGNFHLAPAEAALGKLVDNSYGSGLAAMNAGDYSSGISLFYDTERFIAVNRAFLLPEEDAPAAEETRSVLLKLDALEGALPFFDEIGSVGESFLAARSAGFLSLWQNGEIDTAAAVSGEENLRLSFREMLISLEAIQNRIAAETDAGAFSYLEDSGTLSEKLSLLLAENERASAVRLYTVANGDMEKRVLALENDFAEGNRLIEGVQRETEDGVYTARYPSEGRALLTLLREKIESESDAARALVARYTAESGAAREDAELGALAAGAQNYLERLVSLQNESGGIIAAAGTQIEIANALRVEGERLFQEAQSALARNNFDLARENLDRVTSRYNASLVIQESSALRDVWQTQVMPLGDEIKRVENEVIVRDVRALLTSARTRYYAGNMEQAEDALVRAQNRWRVTNVTEQPEVEYWLRLVRGAMSLQSGRNIPVTAPLYAEMSQLLSESSKNYNEGTRLLNAGRRREGLVYFNAAMEKTREVRLIFPMNHDARMLELRIEMQTDTAAFNAAFRQRLSAAVAGTKERNTESFADLQNLAEINPGYPGIRDLVAQAEIDMGLRPPPPDPRDLARSAELSRDARNVINARETMRYETARVWLDEAITLNPDNTQAQSLLDQLQILMTGTGTIVLDSYAQDRYNLAVQEFTRGNYLSANAIVLQLLQNPESQKSTLIQDLKRRIDAAL